LVILQK
jgi:hypothetical protein